MSQQIDSSTKPRKANGAGKKRKHKIKNTGSQQGNKRSRKEEKKNASVKNQSFTEEARTDLKLYTQLKAIYEEEGVTQKTHQFLTRIAKKKVINQY